MWIDLHCHLDKLKKQPSESIADAKAVGVERIVTIGTDPSDLPVVLAIAEKYFPEVYCTLGIHPHDGGQYTPEAEKFIRDHLQRPEVVAVGEIGLDYYYQHSSQEDQQRAFRAQLEIAKEFKMPIEIHTRDAEKDTIEILNEYKGSVTGIIHCFTGTSWLAQQALDLGYNISISGVVTFKNADSLRETVKMIPLDRLHVETDAPFLAPIPMRGQENTPSFVVHTGEFVAKLKQVELVAFQQQMKLNAKKMFPKIQWA